MRFVIGRHGEKYDTHDLLELIGGSRKYVLKIVPSQNYPIRSMFGAIKDGKVQPLKEIDE